MCGTMNVRVEVWPVTADRTGIWLLSPGDALRSSPVPQDGDVHFEVENLLADRAMLSSADIIHSTSWRPDGPSIILTYVAVIHNALSDGETILDVWPEAQPISIELATLVGKPATNAANQPPVPRYIDVLLHSVRHLGFLLVEDATASAALTPLWRKHLATLKPALAGMYSETHNVGL